MCVWKQLVLLPLMPLTGAFCPAQAGWVNINRDFGDDHGLCNLAGREILPAKYPRLEYVGRGLFIVFERAEGVDHRYDLSGVKFVFDQQGRRINIPVPEDTIFHDIRWCAPPKPAQTKQSSGRLSDALIVFEKNYLLGLCDPAGKQLLPAEYSQIGACNESTIFLSRQDGHCFVYDAHYKVCQ
jgi:hypothetical protein